MAYDVTTFTVKVDSMVADRFRDTLREQRSKGIVTSFTDNGEPPLNGHHALEQGVMALLREGKTITAVKLVKDYFAWPLGQCKDTVLYYKDRT